MGDDLLSQMVQTPTRPNFYYQHCFPLKKIKGLITCGRILYLRANGVSLQVSSHGKIRGSDHLCEDFVCEG